MSLQVREDAHLTWAEQLSCLRITKVDTVHILAQTATSAQDQPTTLRACIAAAQLLQCTPRQYALQGWYADEDVISELDNLPHGTALALTLKPSSQAAAAARCHPLARLPSVVPRSFTTYYVRAGELKQEAIEALVFGAPADRSADAPINFWVAGFTYTWINKVKAELRERSSYRHVFLWYWGGP